MQKAKELCEDLLANVRQQYEQFKERGPSRRGYGGDGDRYSGGGRNGGRSDSYGGGYGGNSSYGGGSSYGNQQSPGYGSAMSPTSQTTPATPATAASDPYAAYAQYYAAGGDPYAAYGGYQNYVNMYYQYAQQQQQQQGAPPGSEAPPPPPGSAPPPPPGDAPPPPPPSGSPPGGYSAVCIHGPWYLRITIDSKPRSRRPRACKLAACPVSYKLSMVVHSSLIPQRFLHFGQGRRKLTGAAARNTLIIIRNGVC